MNRHCHRLVYNRARGQVMAVAESAMQSSCAPGQCARSGAGMARSDAPLRARLPALQMALWVAWGLLTLPASAQIRADPGWLTAQGILFELGERFRQDPLTTG